MKQTGMIFCQRGFTLLEIIVALIVASVIVAMMVPFLSSTVTRSVDSVNSAIQHASLSQVMENITSDYKRLSSIDYSSGTAAALPTLTASIGAEGQHMSNNYGTYDVISNRYIAFPSGSPATEMQDGSVNVLKVKISYQGYTLTALFTR